MRQGNHMPTHERDFMRQSKLLTCLHEGRPVRFTHVRGEVFVSRADFIATAHSCFTDKQQGELLVRRCFTMAGYDYDFRVAQLGESEIGPAIHHLTLSDLTSTLQQIWRSHHPDDPEHDAIKARLTKLHGELKVAVWESVSHFAISTSALISSIERRPTRERVRLPVKVSQQNGLLHATCQKIGLSLKAAHKGSLEAAVWDCLPSLLESHDSDLTPSRVTLAFHYDEELVDDHHH